MEWPEWLSVRLTDWGLMNHLLFNNVSSSPRHFVLHHPPDCFTWSNSAFFLSFSTIFFITPSFTPLLFYSRYDSMYQNECVNWYYLSHHWGSMCLQRDQMIEGLKWFTKAGPGFELQAPYHICLPSTSYVIKLCSPFNPVCFDRPIIWMRKLQ